MERETKHKTINKKDSLSKTIITLALENKFLVNSLRVMRTELVQAYTTRNSEEKLIIINHTINHINKILGMDEYNQPSQNNKLSDMRVRHIVKERR